MKRKIFVLDTSVLLYDKAALYAFTGNDIVIPLIVLDELDRFKEKPGLLGENARFVNRFLDDLRSQGELSKGVSIDNDQTIRVELIDGKKYVPDTLDNSLSDNKIIGTAKYLQKKSEQEVKLITKDINLRVKCDSVGVPSEDYLKDHVEDGKITGWKEIETTKENLDKFYTDGQIQLPDSEFHINQFIVGKHGQQSFLGKAKSSNFIKKLTFDNISFIGVEPRNCEQAFAIDALLDPNIPLVTLTGLAGSGKTFLALMAGLSKLSSGNTPKGRTLGADFPEELRTGYDRLVITRTLQPVGKDLGYLPGSMEDKMAPWLMPIIDNVRHAFKDISYFQMMVEKGDVEVAPIPYIRGRTFNNSFVIVDEAQNATIHELKTIITRIGKNSKIVLLGDTDQIDTPYINKKSNGLTIIAQKFKNSKLAAHIHLSKGQRSDLASTAADLL